jgi:hypothetical protein
MGCLAQQIAEESEKLLAPVFVVDIECVCETLRCRNNCVVDYNKRSLEYCFMGLSRSWREKSFRYANSFAQK